MLCYLFLFLKSVLFFKIYFLSRLNNSITRIYPIWWEAQCIQTGDCAKARFQPCSQSTNHLTSYGKAITVNLKMETNSRISSQLPVHLSSTNVFCWRNLTTCPASVRVSKCMRPVSEKKNFSPSDQSIIQPINKTST